MQVAACFSLMEDTHCKLHRADSKYSRKLDPSGSKPCSPACRYMEGLDSISGVTTLARIGTGAAAGARTHGLGLSAVAGEPAHRRDGGYGTTHKCGAEHPKRFAP